VTDLAPIAGKLANFLRLLASDKEGEVVAAARALNRTLKSAKLDIHALADSISQANGKEYTEEQLLKGRELGIAEGRRFRRTVHGGEPTEKQASWLRKIYARV
jgi:hypothetical protein